MGVWLCSPAESRTNREAARLLAGERRVKVARGFCHGDTEAQRDSLELLLVAEALRAFGADDGGGKLPKVSRLDKRVELCFFGVAGNSNRGVPIRKAVMSEE